VFRGFRLSRSFVTFTAAVVGNISERKLNPFCNWTTPVLQPHKTFIYAYLLPV
jgi:hypothetical protein